MSTAAVPALGAVLAVTGACAVVLTVLLWAVARESPGLVGRVCWRIFCPCSSSARIAPGVTDSSGSRRIIPAEERPGGKSAPQIPDKPVRTPKAAVATRLAAGGELDENVTYEWEIDPKRLKMKGIIGKGNFGEVWLATWLGSPVAVKTMLPELHGKDKLVRRFIDEILLMSTLHHPNVVLFLGASIRRPHLFLVLEYCVHGSLHHFLKNEAQHGVRVSMSLIYRFALDIARGVYYLHRRANVLQRDLKARNVLVDESLNAKVADFGLSRIMAEVGDDNKLTACGTPAWTAPEIVKMERYTEKVDVYSFGIILWELITRQEPYGGQKGVQIAYAAAEQGLRPKIPAYCPPEYAELMQECWAGRPDDRPSFEEILRRLFQLKKAADAAAANALAEASARTASGAGAAAGAPEAATIVVSSDGRTRSAAGAAVAVTTTTAAAALAVVSSPPTVAPGSTSGGGAGAPHGGAGADARTRTAGGRDSVTSATTTVPTATGGRADSASGPGLAHGHPHGQSRHVVSSSSSSARPGVTVATTEPGDLSPVSAAGNGNDMTIVSVAGDMSPALGGGRPSSSVPRNGNAAGGAGGGRGDYTGVAHRDSSAATLPAPSTVVPVPSASADADGGSTPDGLGESVVDFARTPAPHRIGGGAGAGAGGVGGGGIDPFAPLPAGMSAAADSSPPAPHVPGGGRRISGGASSAAAASGAGAGAGAGGHAHAPAALSKKPSMRADVQRAVDLGIVTLPAAAAAKPLAGWDGDVGDGDDA